MVSATKQLIKAVTWTAPGIVAFKNLKDLVNAYPKLYFIRKDYKIFLRTDASDYAQGAYLPIGSCDG